MRTPPLKPYIISALPVLSSTFTVSTLVWHFNVPELITPLVLGIIAGGLVDLDNRLTGRLKNIVVSMCLFALASVTAQMTLGKGLWYAAAMMVMTFCFTLLGAVGLRYRTFAFGTLAVAVYTSLAHVPGTLWYAGPLLILSGTLIYSLSVLFFQMIFPHRPVQESVAAAYETMGRYFETKADFFDPDEAEWLENRQIDLAMVNSDVTAAFNRCRNALFYRMRGQHRHPRTQKMLRYYFVVQDIHERISSAHADYRELAEKLKNSDLIFRIHRLLELQGQACRNVAESLRSGKDYDYGKRLGRAMEGCRQSLAVYGLNRNGSEIHHLQQLIDNLTGVDYQLRHLSGSKGEAGIPEDARIAGQEKGGLKYTLQTVKSQLNFESSVFRHAVRLSIAVTCACLIIYLFIYLFGLDSGYWILLTTLFVCQPNYSATKSRVNQRIVGTVVGVVVGSLVPYFTPSVETKLWIIIASTTLFFLTRSYKYSFSTFFITVQALTSLSLSGFDVFTATPWRIIDTLIGAAIAWAAVTYLWPDWRYLTLNQTAAQAVSGSGAYLRKILEQLQNGSTDDIAYRVVRRQMNERAAALSSTLSNMSSDPEKYGESLQDGFNLLKTNYALIGYISALGAYRNQMEKDFGGGFAEIFYQTAHCIADVLEQLHAMPSETFQTALNEIQNSLQTLQQELPDNRQSSVLWQQLNLIARQLPVCYGFLNRSQNSSDNTAEVLTA
ncbi:YccS family putative transporter [Neisseria sp.]|uniref:YccS family putative transporter n=1 Tax=Neisseria sp. TaxID=192066 RepID=UPI0035A1441A